MNMLRVVIAVVHLILVTSKKKYRDESSESIENILYYKDCNHKQKPTQVVTPLRSPPQKQECKMCCTLCCGDQCADSHQVNLGRQQQNLNRVDPKAIQPIVPEFRPPRDRRNKERFSIPVQRPIPGRRGLGFTRENIKNLISQDEDIRKILKNLVRVTMQKVDLMAMLNKKQDTVKSVNDVSGDVSYSENDV